MKKNKTIEIILPDIRSAFNVGSIFRTSDVFGIDKIYICGYTATPEHPKVLKTSLGSEKSVSWQQYKPTLRLIKKLKKQGYYILGLEKTKTSTDIRKTKVKFPLAIIVGNEIRGISKKYLDHCDAITHIEMQGIKESLNVSVAYGIAVFYYSQVFRNFSREL